MNLAASSAPSARMAIFTPRTEFFPPTILRTVPVNDARSISQTAGITAVFSEPATKASGTSVSLHLRDSMVAATVIYNTATKTAVLDPVSMLLADRVYTMRVDDVLDAVGNQLVATTWFFSTGPALTVVKATPANGSTKVRRNDTAIITMSETITGYGLRATGYGLRATGYGLRANDGPPD